MALAVDFGSGLSKVLRKESFFRLPWFKIDSILYTEEEEEEDCELIMALLLDCVWGRDEEDDRSPPKLLLLLLCVVLLLLLNPECNFLRCVLLSWSDSI